MAYRLIGDILTLVRFPEFGAAPTETDRYKIEKPCLCISQFDVPSLVPPWEEGEDIIVGTKRSVWPGGESRELLYFVALSSHTAEAGDQPLVDSPRWQATTRTDTDRLTDQRLIAIADQYDCCRELEA